MSKVLEIVIDGFGYNPELEIEILQASFEKLTAEQKTAFLENVVQEAGEILKENKTDQETNAQVPDELVFMLFFNRNPLNVYFEKKYGVLQKINRPTLDKLIQFFAPVKQELQNHKFIPQINKVIRETAKDMKYAVWAADTPNIDRLRAEYPSISTKTTGIHAGYEDLRPEVQGNSETGHQQLGNLVVAPQIPLEISTDIASGNFFKNPVLCQSIQSAIDRKVNLNISFMVSGENGDDGRVHSCWDHLEAFLELVFNEYKFDPDRLRIQAILDGRDCPLKSSIVRDGDRYGFLFKLRDLLAKYKAEDSIAWIIGRGIAMDRDYEEERTKKDYHLLCKGEAYHIANDFEDAIASIEAFHEEEVFDPFVEPIIIRDKNRAIRKLENHDVFVDLNFRADRQRARVAALLGAKDFLREQAAAKNREWAMDWMIDDLDVAVYCMTEYHPELEKNGAKIAYPIKPQLHNFLSLFSKYFRRKAIPFKFLLTAESNKSIHMGYFIRARREKLRDAKVEKKFVIPSYAEEDGIFTDDDFYKTPHMKALEIAGKVSNALASGTYDLGIVNISNPDMLGHLINEHFEACVRGLEVTDYAVKMMVEWATKLEYFVIITSDHGNIDEFSSSHSLNDVITTFVSPDDSIKLKKDLKERIRLFDIPWAIAEIYNITTNIQKILPPVPHLIKENGLVGESPISCLRKVFIHKLQKIQTVM